MNSVITRVLILCWPSIVVGALCLAQAQSIGGFPPGVFQNRAALDGGVGPYVGPGDVVPGASAWWGLRGYNAAFSGNVANICDAATGLVCADVTWSGTALVFPTIGGVACNNVTNICQVKTLYDQSGGSNCSGPCNLTNATAANRPTLVLNCINTTLPCMRFLTASVQVLSNTTGSTSFSQPYTVSAVAKSTSAGVDGAFFASRSAVELYRLQGDGHAQMFVGGNNLFAVAPINQFHSLQAIANGASPASSWYVDGTSTTGTTGVDTLGGQLDIGNDIFGGAYTGDIVEVGFWNSDFSASGNTAAAAMCHNQFLYWATVTSC